MHVDAESKPAVQTQVPTPSQGPSEQETAAHDGDDPDDAAEGGHGDASEDAAREEDKNKEDGVTEASVGVPPGFRLAFANSAPKNNDYVSGLDNGRIPLS